MKILFTGLCIANGTRTRIEKAEKMAADSIMIATRFAYCKPWPFPTFDIRYLRNSRSRREIARVRRMLSERETVRNTVVHLIEPSLTGTVRPDTCSKNIEPAAEIYRIFVRRYD